MGVVVAQLRSMWAYNQDLLHLWGQFGMPKLWKVLSKAHIPCVVKEGFLEIMIFKLYEHVTESRSSYLWHVYINKISVSLMDTRR